MRENFPDFNIEVFENEIGFIFEQNFNAYLNHDMKLLKKLAFQKPMDFFKVK